MGMPDMTSSNLNNILLDQISIGLMLLDDKNESIIYANHFAEKILEIDSIDEIETKPYVKKLLSLRVYDHKNAYQKMHFGTFKDNMICCHVNFNSSTLGESEVLMLSLVECRSIESPQISYSTPTNSRKSILGKWIWKIKKNEIIWSDRTYRIFGEEPEKFELNFQNYIDKIHPGDRNLVENHIEKTLSSSSLEFTEIKHRIVTSKGEIKYVSCNGILSLSKHGDPIELSGTVEDITEESLLNREMDRIRKSLQPVLDNSQKPLDQLSNLQVDSGIMETERKLRKVTLELKNFVAMATHILRGPISSIIAVSNMTDSKAFPPDELMGMIQNTSTRLSRNLSDLILVGDLNYVNPKIEPLQLRPLANLVLSNILSEYEPGSIGIDMNVDGDLVLNTDARILNIVLNVVLSNAVKYGKTGSIVKIHMVHFWKDGHVLEISDEGPGISANNINHIFKMFYRGNNNSDGPGLGLYTARKALGWINGSIKICTDYKKGTKVIIRL